jgi:hypothetical protein
MAPSPGPPIWVISSSSNFPLAYDYVPTSAGGDTPPTEVDWNPQGICSGVVTITAIVGMTYIEALLAEYSSYMGGDTIIEYNPDELE